MATYADTLTFTNGDRTHTITRAAVEAAASRLTPAHQTSPRNPVWFALVGGGVHYVCALVKQATDQDVKVDEARLLLHDLGFQILAWMWTRTSVEAAHPCHGGTKSTAPGA
ncbi:hypothetical protein [Streptomyces sp. NPDC096339]|uniref:hypothetical protein n=1 Tax=Streptomyces sp. NPDC096339 TaxID=3366086 RepID=UPI003810A9FB